MNPEESNSDRQIPPAYETDRDREIPRQPQISYSELEPILTARGQPVAFLRESPDYVWKARR